MARILILGLTFKENCSDLRNTRVIDLAREFQEYGASVDIHSIIGEGTTVRIRAPREPQHGLLNEALRTQRLR